MFQYVMLNLGFLLGDFFVSLCLCFLAYGFCVCLHGYMCYLFLVLCHVHIVGIYHLCTGIGH